MSSLKTNLLIEKPTIFQLEQIIYFIRHVLKQPTVSIDILLKSIDNAISQQSFDYKLDFKELLPSPTRMKAIKSEIAMNKFIKQQQEWGQFVTNDMLGHTERDVFKLDYEMASVNQSSIIEQGWNLTIDNILKTASIKYPNEDTST